MKSPCPQCGRVLSQSGTVSVKDDAGMKSFPIFQCDRCHVPIELMGEAFEGVYTFALDADGKPFDPASLDEHLPGEDE